MSTNASQETCGSKRGSIDFYCTTETVCGCALIVLIEKEEYTSAMNIPQKFRKKRQLPFMLIVS